MMYILTIIDDDYRQNVPCARTHLIARHWFAIINIAHSYADCAQTRLVGTALAIPRSIIWRNQIAVSHPGTRGM